MAVSMDEATGEALQGLLSWAEELLSRAQALQAKEAGIAGIGKLIKKIHSERTFVKSLQNDSVALKGNQLKSTNLSHLEGVLHSAESFGRVLGVLLPFHYEADEGQEGTVVVDSVARGGAAWVKVTARKARALHRKWEGEGEYGEHDIVEQAKQYLRASQQHPINYQPPAVHVVFYSGVTQAIVDKELYACQTAINDFQKILATIAGPQERKRAQRLLARITLVEDNPSDRASQLEESHRIKHRAKVIFGTGDKMKAITTTANVGFVRATGNKGVSFAVHIHQSRALTEKKRSSDTHAQQGATCRPSSEATLGGSIRSGRDSSANNCPTFGTAIGPTLQKCP